MSKKKTAKTYTTDGAVDHERSNGGRMSRLDDETRECCISVITDYCAAFGPRMALDLIGWRSNRTDRALADAQAPAVLAALLPTLGDDELNMLMRAIAETMVNDLAKKARAA